MRAEIETGRPREAILEEARLGREELRVRGTPTIMLVDGTKLRHPIAHARLREDRVVGVTPLPCHGDGCIEATRELVKEGFTVLAYTSDDPRSAVRIKEAGAASVMPAGSPIGSGQGILNPNNIRICLEYLKEGDPDYPVIVDAGVGTASDVTVAMELGVDGVLLNTGIAHARDPLTMARAMRAAVEAGRLAYLAGRIPKKLYATASSPVEGTIAPSKPR